MKVAIISPTAYLPLLSGYQSNTYHLALAQRILSDPTYKEFYLKLPQHNIQIILDNGACELGESIPTPDLIQACNLINPHILVLPDVLNDGHKTINLVYKFLSNFPLNISQLKFMAVVQGKTKQEWLDCLLQINKLNSVQYIGISNTNAIFNNDQHEFSRVKTINWLIENKLINPTKKIHLLGLGNSGHLEISQLKHHSIIEGVDTNGPVVHAYHGIKFSPKQKYTKIRTYLPPNCILTSDQITLAQHNITILFKSANYLPQLSSI